MQKNKNTKRDKKRPTFSRNKKLALGVLVVLLLVGLGFGGWLLFGKDESVQLSQAEQREVEQVDSERAKKEAEDARLGISGDPLKDGDDGEQTVEPPSGGEATLSQPSFEQAGGMIKSSVNISGVTGGNCEFNFSTEADRPVVKLTALSNGACSVEIPEVEFARLGEWQLAVSYEGTSVSRKVQIN